MGLAFQDVFLLEKLDFCLSYDHLAHAERLGWWETGLFRGKRRKILEPEFSLGQAGNGCQCPTETFPLPSVATEHETSTKGERKEEQVASSVGRAWDS